MSDMDSIRRNKGFPMKRIFQRWTLVMMMLAPAMVRATPILDFSSGFAGSTSSLEFQWLGPNLGHPGQNHQWRISSGRERVVEESGRYSQVQLSIYVPDYIAD